jgi:type III secretion system FlhB-like substrate exporter
MPDASKGKVTNLDPQMAQLPKSSFYARMVDGVRYVVSGITPNTWFSPGQPVFPVTEDPTARGRRFDYPVGYNLQIQPRIESGTSFTELRNLADAHDLTRLCIETRKDQVARMPWSITMKDKKAKPDEKRIKAITKLLAMPDGVNPFRTWIRMALEEVLVIDALTIEPRKNALGELVRLDLVSGETIKPVLDADGRVPMPPNPAYQQVLHGVPTANFSTDDILYFVRNPRVHKVYGFSPVEQILLRVNTALRRDIKTLQHYTDGNVPAGIYLAPESWTADQIKLLNDYFNATLQGNTAAQNQVIFLAGGTGTQFIETKKVDLKDKFDEWLARVVCFAFSIPPGAFTSDVNRATAEEQGAAGIEEGLLPLLEFLEEMVNLVLAKWGGYDDIQFSFQKDGAIDNLADAQADEIRIRSGAKSIDEVREKNGDKPIGLGHGIITPTGFLALPTEENKRTGLYKEPEPLEPPDDEPKPPKPGKEAEAEEEENAPPVPTDKVQKKKKVAVKFQPDSYSPEVLASFRGTVAKFLADQAKRNAKRMVRVYETVQKADKDAVTAILEAVDLDAFVFLLDPATKALKSTAEKTAASNLLAIQNVLDPEDLDEVFGRVNEAAARYGRTRGAQLVGKKWVDGELVDNPNAKWAITEPTRDMLRSTVTDALDNGWTSQQLQQAIMQNEAFSASRAQMIARTELSRAASQGSRDAWKGAGLKVRKRNALSSAHEGPDECDECTAQGWLPFDEAFASGEQESPHHPRCACDIEYEVEADEDQEDIQPERLDGRA